jgi:hypothetical protein
MPLDDAQVERYSRQLILQEIGPRGQARLMQSRVAVTVTGPAAERATAYLAAAGIGTLALPPALHTLVDPAHRGVRIEPLALHAAPGLAVPGPFDAALVSTAAEDAAPRTRHTFWIAGGRAAELPPCATCASAALGPDTPVGDALAPLRDALLGTVVATEIVKALLKIGTPLIGHVLTYDAETATVTTTPVAPRAACARCRLAKSRKI